MRHPHPNAREGSKQSVQPGRSPFHARSVHAVREHGKRARTPLAAFFNIPLFIAAILPILIPAYSSALQGSSLDKMNEVLHETQDLLGQFQFQAALNRLDEAIHIFPEAPALHKKRGDVLMILGQNQEALTAYRQALTLAPDWIEGHWALWALLDRLRSNSEEALQTLIQIANLDVKNPLAQLHVARKLRELCRFEESTLYFQRAVNIDPNHLAYRLFLARALFDTRDTAGALREVEWVLSHASANSPVMVAAQNLADTVHGGTLDQGGRTDFFETTKKQHGQEGKDYKSWALTRERAWQFMKAANYEKAEVAWRKVLTLDSEDDLARYNLGLTLIKLGKYEDAIASLKASFEQSKHPPFYPDAVFQLGRVLAKLERWEEAVSQFEHLLTIQDWKDQDFYAMNFPPLPNIQAALEEAKSHITGATKTKHADEDSLRNSLLEPFLEPIQNPDALSKSPQNILGPSKIPRRVLPLSVDNVRGWFRQLITAKSVIQDERQAGFHEFIPLDPGDTFPPHQPSIYLVFFLTTPPAGTNILTSQWIAEKVKGLPDNTVVGTDSVFVELGDQSGYFLLNRPEGEWPAGTYRVDLFAGEDVSSYTQIADVRFQIKSIPQ